ncbi:hypothetical protein [Marinobacter vulgaris]|uniref:hypothetical protein n=1 Tax=Marinobacter vulgaris TaxID=1928331 RepID=UPI0011824B2D|nr:hypothetical protein [Marinobacter vulgaris]TSJ69727.1 hypothetical protein FPC41_12500 [Marinobacter vulgaris]
MPSHPVAFLCALPWLLLAALGAILASGHGLALTLVTTVPVIGAIFQYRRTGLLSGANSVTGLRIENQRLYVRLGCDAQIAVSPCDESRMGASFAILKLRRIGSISGTYPVVLVALTPWLSNTSPEAFRQLRVWLRLGPSSGATRVADQQPPNVQKTH